MLKTKRTKGGASDYEWHKRGANVYHTEKEMTEEEKAKKALNMH